MTSFHDAHAALEEAYRRPALRLIRRKWATFNLACFEAAFGAVRQVATDRLHALVDDNLEQCRRARIDAPQDGGSALCAQWVREGWLRRVDGADGSEYYELTSATLDAMDATDKLRDDRIPIGESRLTTLLDAARRLADKANPDRDSRLERLNAEIAELTAQRDALSGGGELPVGSEDEMIEGYENLRSILASLPGDFRRVEEKIRESLRDMLDAFRAGIRPKGEILEELQAYEDDMYSNTEAGRAFVGVMRLLESDQRFEDFRADIHTILAHPFSEALLRSERQALSSAPDMLNTATRAVPAANLRVLESIYSHIHTADAAEEQELLSLFRRLEVQLREPDMTDKVTVEWELPILGKWEAPPLFFTDLYDFGLDAPLPDLEESTGDESPPDVDALLTGGGPRTEEVLAALAPALRRGATVGEAFSALPAHLRRPVEIPGLLQDLGVRQDGSPDELFHAVRPDGTVRVLRVPALLLPKDLA